MTRLVLPYPPSINHYYGRSRNGRVYIKAQGKEYRELVWSMSRKCPDKYTEPVAVTFTLYPPDQRKRDLDNVLKAMQDALEYAGVIENDALINDLRIVRADPVKGGRVVCEIRVMEAAHV